MTNPNSRSRTSLISPVKLIKIYKILKANPDRDFMIKDFQKEMILSHRGRIYLDTLIKMGLVVCLKDDKGLKFYKFIKDEQGGTNGTK